jgi:hypothetical protein
MHSLISNQFTVSVPREFKWSSTSIFWKTKHASLSEASKNFILAWPLISDLLYLFYQNEAPSSILVES